MVLAEVVRQPAWMRLRRALSPFMGPFLVAVAYYVSAQAAFLIGTLSDRIFAPFWPPNVVLFCALALSRRDRWWAILGAAFPAHAVAEIGVGMPPVQLLVAFLGNTIVAVLNALTLHWFSSGPPWFGSIRKTTTYILATAGFNPALAALAGALVPILGGGDVSDYWIYWSNWYVGNALAALTLGPIILAWTEGGSRTVFSASLRRKIEAVLFIVSLLVTSVLSFKLAVEASGSVFIPVILYLPLPIVLWGSVRFGEKGASGAILVLTVSSVWLTLNGPSPFLDASPEKSVLALQLFLIGIAVPVLLLTAAVDQLRHTEQTTRALAGSILRAQDDERRRIARELHDSTGQNLIAASLLVGTFRDALPEPALSNLKKWEEVLRRSIREIRTLSYVLHPPSLDEGGLRSALPDYVEGFGERTGIQIDLEMSPDLKRLSADAELALYRIVQEALGNVHRHSGSDTARIRLRRRMQGDRDVAVLTVEDRGKGFQPNGHRTSGSVVRRRGLGLESMRERIHQIGGRLSIESSPGKTVVTAVLPLAPATVRTER